MTDGVLERSCLIHHKMFGGRPTMMGMHMAGRAQAHRSPRGAGNWGGARCATGMQCCTCTMQQHCRARTRPAPGALHRGKRTTHAVMPSCRRGPRAARGAVRAVARHGNGCAGRPCFNNAPQNQVVINTGCTILLLPVCECVRCNSHACDPYVAGHPLQHGARRHARIHVNCTTPNCATTPHIAMRFAQHAR